MSGEDHNSLFHSLFGHTPPSLNLSLGRSTADPRELATSRLHDSFPEYDTATQSGSYTAHPFRGAGNHGYAASSRGSHHQEQWGQQPSLQSGFAQQQYPVDEFGQTMTSFQGEYGNYGQPNFSEAYSNLGYGGVATYAGGSSSHFPPQQDYAQAFAQAVNINDDDGDNNEQYPLRVNVNPVERRQLSQIWLHDMSESEQNAMVDMLFDYTGFDPTAIKRACRYKTTEEVRDGVLGGTEDGIALASRALFPSLTKARRKENWTKPLKAKEVEKVLRRMVRASGRGELFVWNALAREHMTIGMAREILRTSSEECLKEIALYDLKLTENPDPQQQHLHAAGRFASTENLPWKVGTNVEQRKPFIIDKIMKETGRSEDWAYVKLRRSDRVGLGRSIMRAEGEELNELINYLRSL
jgi:hypothetical protein